MAGLLAAAWALASLSEGSVSDAMRAQRAALEALKIASWANPTAERITTAQQGARERLMAAYPGVSEPEFVPTSDHTYTQSEVRSLAPEDREMLYEFQLAQAKVHAGLALTMLQDDTGGSGQRGEALARQQSSVMDAIAQTEAASHRANSEQEEALIAKLRRAPAPLGLKFDDSPAPKEDRSPHDFSHELADSQRPASAGSVEQLRQRPASATSGDDKLREYKAVDGDESSIWLPDGAQRRQRRQYQDVVTHEKTLADRVIDKNARIDELVKENKAREEELEAASTKLQRPASASSGDEPLREYKVVENGVEKSIWLPEGAQRRQRRRYQDVVIHEKALNERVDSKDARIDKLVQEKDARIGELEAKAKRLELAKTKEMVKERKLENELIDSQKAQVSSEAQADDLRAQMEALQATTPLRQAVSAYPGGGAGGGSGRDAAMEAIDHKLEAIQGQTEAAVKSALDVAAKATSQVDKLVAGAIARDKANALSEAEGAASEGKAGAVEDASKADELLRQMEANAERAAQKVTHNPNPKP